MADARAVWAAVTITLDDEDPLPGARGRLVRAARFLALTGQHPTVSASARAAGVVRTTAQSWLNRDGTLRVKFGQAQRSAPIEDPSPVHLDVADLDAELDSISRGYPPSRAFTDAVFALVGVVA